MRRLAAVKRLTRALATSRLAAEPAAAALLAAEAARLGPTHRRPLTDDDVASALGSLRRPLYAYQREGVARFLAAGSLLLADDMGLGKTTQAVAASHVLFNTGRVRRGLFIVPASLKSQWLREWRQVSDAPIALVDGSAEQRVAQYRDTRRGFLV
ncbi:MAG: hypothetical protein KDA75_23285, partial [Planctomycetaceae bacterium]|nr:hypothetical protein [Planctomycetaceae bacterium]